MRNLELLTDIQELELEQDNLVDGVYIVENGEIPSTMIFCSECQLPFFDKQIENVDDHISFAAAQQIAQEHADMLQHTVCQASPQRLM